MLEASSSICVKVVVELKDIVIRARDVHASTVGPTRMLSSHHRLSQASKRNQHTPADRNCSSSH